MRIRIPLLTLVLLAVFSLPALADCWALEQRVQELIASYSEVQERANAATSQIHIHISAYERLEKQANAAGGLNAAPPEQLLAMQQLVEQLIEMRQARNLDSFRLLALLEKIIPVVEQSVAEGCISQQRLENMRALHAEVQDIDDGFRQGDALLDTMREEVTRALAARQDQDGEYEPCTARGGGAVVRWIPVGPEENVGPEEDGGVGEAQQ